MDDASVNAVLADWRTAPVSPRLRHMLGFLERLTLSPQHVDKADVKALLAADISKNAIMEAAFVCALFCVMDRLADAFDFEVPSYDWAKKNGWFLYWIGYKGTSLFG